jgi:hypothetical protein
MRRGKSVKPEGVQDEKNACRRKFPWKLTVLLLCVLFTMFFFGSRKIGYHVDEIYSYGLANSEYLPFLHFGEMEYSVKDWMLEYGPGESLGDLFRNVAKDFKILRECGFRLKESVIYQDYLIAQENSADTRTTTWVPGQDYMDYIAVSESNTFNYASVYYNQRGDVHPPLYYIILHTICSVFQGNFSKWFALSVNMVVLLLTLVVIYKMVREHLGGETAALVTVGVYGLSSGFMNTAVWLRMYALLTFMVAACCYVHLKIAKEGFRLKGRNRRYLMLVVLGGYLTHYYFVLYAIGAAGVFVLWMLIGKKWRETVKYLLTLAGTAVVGLCIWPYSVRHVFSGYQGQEALNTILNGEFYTIRIKLILDQIWGRLFGGNGWILLLCLCAVAGVLVWKYVGKQNWGGHLHREQPQGLENGRTMYRDERVPEDKALTVDSGLAMDSGLTVDSDRPVGSGLAMDSDLTIGKAVFLVVPVVFYTVVVAQIVPMWIERYVMCTFPFWCLYVVAAVAWILQELTHDRAAGRKIGNLVLAGVGLCLFAVNNCFLAEPDGLYHGAQELVKVPENTDCVYVLPDGDWNESSIDIPILAQCRRVGVVYDTELACLAEDYTYRTGDYVMVAVQNDLDVEEVVAQVCSVLNLEDMIEIHRQQGATAVRVMLTRRG